MPKDEVTVNVKGLRELERVLKKLPERMGRLVLLKSLRAGAKPIIDAAKAKAPVETGRLRDSIIARAQRIESPLTASVAVGPAGRRVFYGHLVEFGTDPHKIKAKPFRVLRLRDGRFVKSVQHQGQTARPFLRPAFDERGSEAMRKIKTELGRNVEKAARRLAKGG